MALHNCDQCGDRIGIWEPAVFVTAEAHPTTQAASPDLAANATGRYHRACYMIASEAVNLQAAGSG